MQIAYKGVAGSEYVNWLYDIMNKHSNLLCKLKDGL